MMYEMNAKLRENSALRAVAKPFLIVPAFFPTSVLAPL
jgi:hypothetical protein